MVTSWRGKGEEIWNARRKPATALCEQVSYTMRQEILTQDLQTFRF